MALNGKEGIQFELNYSLSCTVHGKVSEQYIAPLTLSVSSVSNDELRFVFGKDELHFHASLHSFELDI